MQSTIERMLERARDGQPTHSYGSLRAVFGDHSTAQLERQLHKSQDLQADIERQLRALDGFPPPVHQDRATAASLAVALTDWQGQLLARLQQLDPTQFEYLAAKLLQSAGLTEVRVLGGSGDQGIDGVGQHRILRKSFPVYFQCKRYQRSVGPSEVRDFRGVLDGRTGQGLLITTGTFTAAAREEADRRGGAKPIELVDGEELVDLLRDYGLGLVIDDDLGRVLRIDNSFFDRLGRRRG